jgi:hypothetical protein
MDKQGGITVSISDLSQGVSDTYSGDFGIALMATKTGDSKFRIEGNILGTATKYQICQMLLDAMQDANVTLLDLQIIQGAVSARREEVES